PWSCFCWPSRSPWQRTRSRGVSGLAAILKYEPMDDGGRLSLCIGEDDLLQLLDSRHHTDFLEIVGWRHRGGPKERL
ncbi:hypothetical protein PENTCL1PPCAC_30144, partial [Pristionchus entomophagus]